MMEDLEQRFPFVRPGTPHYESVYLTATHPTDGRAVWIRYTVRQSRSSGAVGSVWFTEFRPEGARAAKVSGPVSSDTEHLVVVGEHGAVSPSAAFGSVTGPGMTARWDLVFHGDELPLTHLPYRWMYSAPLPRTKPTSPRPDMLVAGTVEINGRTTDLDGWRGMLGHNWGSEHAEQWIWLRGAGFVEDRSTWLDVVVGRIRLGGVVLPWIANGVLSVSGNRHALGGVWHRPAVRTRADGVDLTLSGADLRTRIAVDAPLARSVGWEYADPTGGIHYVRNCSTAGLRLEITGDRDTVLTTTHGAVYELGAPVATPGLVVQPFPDQ